jgi:hypothetical protein
MFFEEFKTLAPVHNELNPKLWAQDDHLLPEVKHKLTEIAQDFYRYVDIDFPVLDIVITGSNCNYNYTRASDLDLHLITDYSKLQCDREAEELFDSKRLLYEREYDIRIRGIPVTLYVEDLHNQRVSAGVYSVKSDQWLERPQRIRARFDLAKVEKQMNMWRKLIKQAIKSDNLEVARKTLKLLRQFRKEGLKQPQGEFSTANLVYKGLRNDTSLAQLSDLVDRLHSQHLSIRN